MRKDLTRIQMFVCLGVLTAGAGILCPKLIPLFLCNPWVNGVILTVFLVGSVLPLYQVQRLLRDRQFWDRIQSLAPASDLPPDAFNQSSSRFLETLLLTPERKVKTSFTAEEAGMVLKGLARRLNDRHGGTRYIMGILVLLGLLGTFYGLTQTVGAIGTSLKGLSFDGTLSTESFQNMKMTIQKPLAGMEVAFSSSIFGLVGSLILGFFDLLQRKSEKIFINKIESGLLLKQKKNFTKESNGPVYILALLEQTAENLSLLQNRLTQLEDNNVRMAHTWQEVSNTLAKHVQKTTQSQESFDVLCQMQENFTKELRILGTRFVAYADTQSQEMQVLCRDLSQVLEEMTEGRKLALRDLKSEIRVISKTLSMLTSPEECEDDRAAV